VSTRKKPADEAPKPKLRVVPGGTKSDIARAKELIEKYGLQERLLIPKR
jgi:hypothetical protein